MLDSEEEGLLEILLAAAEAEDARNLVGLMGEEVLSPAPADNLSQKAKLRPCPWLMRCHLLPL